MGPYGTARGACDGTMGFMLFRKSLPLFAFALFCCFCAFPAHGQFAVYGTVNGERAGGFTCQAVGGVCATTNGTVHPYGGVFGVFYDFRNLGPVRFGADLRGDIMTSNKSAVEYEGGAGVVRQYGALGGIRASVGTPITILHPYVEALGGYAKTNAASTNVEVYSNYTQVQGLVGLDITVLPYLDIRGIEFGAGALFGPSTHSTESIGAGLVFHFPR